VEHIYGGFSIASRGVSLLYKARLAQTKTISQAQSAYKKQEECPYE